jgi:hypothetical protein
MSHVPPLLQVGAGEAPHSLAVAQALTQPAQGLFNALVYLHHTRAAHTLICSRAIPTRADDSSSAVFSCAGGSFYGP